MASLVEVTNDAVIGPEVTISLDGESPRRVGGPEARVTVGQKDFPGKIIVLDGDGKETVKIDGASELIVGRKDFPEGGKIIVRDFQGHDVFRLECPFGAHLTVGAKEGLAGAIHVLDGYGKETVTIDGAGGDVKLSGADCAELFPVSGEGAADPGTVLVIDDRGVLCVSDRAHDRRVAGVVSGADGSRPGVILNGELTDGVPLALMGRVFCKVDATAAPIEAGDLLTTSTTPGHAMKAGDQAPLTGTVLGKAMAGLASGRGLIPVLVTLR